MNHQKGVGLIEILVSLIILSIGVIGFSVLQIRAVMASQEANYNVQASNLAKNLSERIRMNRKGFSDYGVTGTVEKCETGTGTKECTAQEFAKYDFDQVKKAAQAQGMDLSILKCPAGTGYLSRKCIYVAWGDTTATQGAASPHCTSATDSAYIAKSQCIYMEVYND